MEYQLTTNRLSLTPIGDSDAEELCALFLEYPQIDQYMNWSSPTNVEETQSFIKEFTDLNPDKVTWSIRMDGKIVGGASIGPKVTGFHTFKCNYAPIAYWVFAPFENQDIATEASQAVLKFSFDQLQLDKVELKQMVINKASERVADKLGFRKVGIQERELWMDGKPYDRHLWELLRENFDAS